MLFLKLYAIAFPVFFAIDLVWLGLIAKNFYREQIGHLMSDQVRWVPALIFYCIYIGGIVFFAVIPSLKSGSWVSALLYGAMFGFVCYATYDLTNLATLKNWPVKMVVYDLLWGAFISGATSLIAYSIATHWKTSF